jgi:hypothetical protein
MTDPFNLLTEDWLKASGFKWHQFDRQPTKHWLLWLGAAMADKCTSFEDIGIELAYGAMDGRWFCWLRGDSAGRYHRFIHVRHIETVDDVTGMISGLVGRPFDPAHCYYGHLYTPAQAERMRLERERMDLRLNREGGRWYPAEEDETRGGPLIDHVNAHIKAGRE